MEIKNKLLVALTTMLLLFGVSFSGSSNLNAGTKSPYKVMINSLEALHYDTSEMSLQTIVPDSVLQLVIPELKKTIQVQQEVTFPRNANVSEVLTALLQAKYAAQSDKKVDFLKIQYSLHSEDFSRYLENYPQSKFASEAESKMRCTQQHEAWLNASVRNSSQAYENYCKRYGANATSPLCRYEGYEAISQAENMQVQAIEAWLSVLQKESVIHRFENDKTECEMYSDYLKEYGDFSCLANEARYKLNTCLDYYAWKQALEQGTIEAYQDYVDHFPAGLHSTYAQGQIDDWTAWKVAREKDTYAAYLEYYKKYPRGDSVAWVRQAFIPTEASAVDLGLPSGTCWAPVNVGAVSAVEYGDYYAWGETETKIEYTWESYRYFKDNNGNGKPWTGEKTDAGEIVDIGRDIRGTEYDVAHVKWGGTWKLPTRAQCQELVDKCEWTWWTTQDLHEGYKVTGPNGKSIFLPAAGYCYDDTRSARAGYRGGYWTSERDDRAWQNSYLLRFKQRDFLELNPELHDVFANSLRYGRTVRPVTNVKPNQQTIEPSKQIAPFPQETNFTENVPVIQISGHHAVDLGLPSGVKWSDRNIGSTSPADYGDYYAWGETQTKKSYTRESYKYSMDKNGDGSYDYDDWIDIGSEISGTEYDAAHVKWGGTWKLPTKEQWQELMDCCTWTFTVLEGHKGYKVTGPNGRILFLPAAGEMAEYYGADGTIGRDGYYWSSKKGECLNFDDDKVRCVEVSKIFGLTVRPVTE